MTQATWIIHKEILDRLTPHGKPLAQVITEAGHKVQEVSWKMGQDLQDLELTGSTPVVLYGGHPFVKKIYNQVDPAFLQPGGLGVNDRTRATQYMSHLPLDWFMNAEAHMMTWAMFKTRAKSLFYTHDTNELFIRPDSGFKTFAGQLVKFGTIADDLKTLDQLSGVMPDTLILVAPTQDILGEFRFVIADGKVVTGSEYRWDDKLDIRRDWPEECEALARKVAQHEWQIDIAYTCDVALLEGGPKLVELNGFSCAGLYACDLAKVVQSVSKAAIREFLGDDVDLSED